MNTIRELREKKGITQTELGKVLGVTKNSISYYENGKRQLTPDMLVKLADYFGVTIDDILGRSEEEEQPQTQTSFGRPIQIEYTPVPETEIMVPVVASLRCGYGSAGIPFTIIGEKPVPASMVERWGKEIVLNEAVGDSMIPTIMPGEFMVCYPSDWWDDGMVVIVNVNDSDTVKRIYHAKDGGIDLVPDNPSYKFQHFSPQEIEDYHVSVLAHVLTKLPRDIKPIPRRKEE